MPETSQAFDREAEGYTERWDRSPIVPFWRGRVLARVLGATRPGGRIADLGLGTGTDAVCLASAGFEVAGIDASPGMVAAARRRGADARVGPLAAAPDLLGGDFDTVLCNFGVLNCLTTLAPLRGALTGLLRPGGRVILVWMSRHCPADTLARLARLQNPRRGRAFAVVSGVAVPVRWWSLREVEAALAPDFTVSRVEAIGLLDAPPDVGGRPSPGTRIEPWIASLPGLRELGDHTLVVAERCA